MKVPISLKSIGDHMESLDIEVEVDPVRRVVTLHMLEFDNEHVTTFLTRMLPADFGVRVDGSLPRYDLVVVLAGRHHPAGLQRSSSGGISSRA